MTRRSLTQPAGMTAEGECSAGGAAPLAAAKLPAHAQQATETDCLACRVTGTLVSSACAAYLLAINYSRVPPPAGAHRFALLALSGGFASMAVVRALT